MLGKNEEALASFDRALETYDEFIKVKQNQQALDNSWLNKWNLYYLKASTYSFMNNIQETLNNLEKAIEIDNKRKEEVRKDKNFDKIRDSDEFKKIIWVE